MEDLNAFAAQIVVGVPIKGSLEQLRSVVIPLNYERDQIVEIPWLTR